MTLLDETLAENEKLRKQLAEAKQKLTMVHDTIAPIRKDARTIPEQVVIDIVRTKNA
jgi:predicted nuclease with TOPRIM domain